MREPIIFTVYGFPKPGGSKKAFYIKKLNRVVVTDASNNKGWRKAVAVTAQTVFREEPWTCPIEVEFHFTMPRPKSHYRTGKRASELREDAPGMHSHAPDATKLVRSTEDALTGILWRDDGQICRQTVSKRYGCKPGVQITMRAACPSKREPESAWPESFPKKFADMKATVAGTPGTEARMVRKATAADVAQLG